MYLISCNSKCTEIIVTVHDIKGILYEHYKCIYMYWLPSVAKLYSYTISLHSHSKVVKFYPYGITIWIYFLFEVVFQLRYLTDIPYTIKWLQYSPYNFPNADNLQNMLSIQCTLFQYQTLLSPHSDAHLSEMDFGVLLW